MDGKEMRKSRNQEKEHIYEEYAKAIRECGEKYIGHPVTVNGDGTIEVM